MNRQAKRAVSVLLAVIMIIAALPPLTVSAAYSFSGGSGTSSDPYLVSTPDDILNIKNYTSKYFRQICDISMAGYSMTPISGFTGTYDGGGFAISDLKMSTTVYVNMGLFGTNYGTIKNVKLLNCSISSSVSGDFFCGGIVGRNYSSGKILDCSVSGSVSAHSIYVNGEVYVGGIVGLNQGLVENCRNSAAVSAGYASAADNYAGGIVGNNNATVKNCFNQGSITVNKGRNCLAAGIAAINFGSITGVENTGDIYANSTVVYDGYSSDSYAGGVVGYNKSMLSYAKNSGFVQAVSSADNAEAGGIAAYNGAEAYATGTYVVEKCKNTGDVTARSTAGESRAGGIAATSYMNSYVRYCCNSGNVSATENKQYNLCMAGGIVGSLMYATMIQSCNHGDVTISATQYDGQVCGLATTTEAVIKDCYTTGNIYVNSSVVRYSNGRGAPLFIDSDTTCLNCYNTGAISKKYGGNEIRGLYGLSGGTDRNIVQNCFTTVYDGVATSNRMTAEQSKQQATYTGYDFNKIWAIDASINEGRPYLRNIPADGDNGWYVENIVSVTGITLSQTFASMTTGQMLRLYATVLPQNATDQSITWSSSNTPVATVDANGVVTAVRNGTATIYAKSVDGGYRASCTVSIPTKSVTFSGGTGTQSDPYLVSTPQDVVNILYRPTAHYRQVANISMKNVAFTPIGTEQTPFSGSYDGNGYSISDLTLTATDERMYLALFGCSSGTVSNVKIKNFYISNTSTFGSVYAAALVAYNKGTIKDCHVNATVTATAYAEGKSAFAGGLSAVSPSNSFTNCSFSGEVRSKVYDIDSKAYSGGICASGYGAENCQNYGTIRAEGAASCDVFSGGIIGHSTGSIYRCYNKGYIEGTNSRSTVAGGITGRNNGIVYYSTNEGEIFASTAYTDFNDTVYAYAGGISGSNYSTVRYGYNKGLIHSSSVSSHAYAGGVVGYNQASSYIYYSKNIGEVKAGSTGGESRAGGIASSSHKDSKIMYCCNSGSVSIYDNPYYWLGLAGGVVAVLQYGSIEQCCNHGTVTIDSKNYYPIGGGICSFTDSTVKNCYSDGNVHSNFAYHESYNPGMLCGIGEGCGSNVTNCYFAGQLTSKYSYTEKYGLAWTNGRGGNTFTGCYTVNLYSGTEYSSRMTDAASKLQSTYAGYDFSSVWAIDANKNNGRPYLRNIPSDTSSNWYRGITVQPSLDGHVESDWIVSTAASCTTDGEKYVKCTVCGKVLKTEKIFATGHSYKEVVTNPTCTEQGYTTHTCSTCGDSYVDTYVNALGHSYGEWVQTKAPTETEQGENRRDCKNCDAFETTPIEILAHDHSRWEAIILDAVAPTCTDTGLTEGKKCSKCGEILVAQSTVSALGHDMGAWAQTKAPACTEKGSERRDCSRCDYFEERDVEANGHSYSAVVTPPTCTEQGYTTHTCSTCGDSYVDTYVNALGHDMGAWTQTKAPTCTEKGSERRDCTRCDHFETREVTEKRHSYKAVATQPTCAEQGYTTYTCDCGDSYVSDYVDARGYEWMLDDGEFNILLIGNSFSKDASNVEMPNSQMLDILQAMLGDHVSVTVGVCFSGGKGLNWHATQSEQGNKKYSLWVINSENGTWESCGSSTSANALAWTDWDVVSLQHYGIDTTTGKETNSYPDQVDPKFDNLKSATEFMLDYVDQYAPNAAVFFYMHWARASKSMINESLDTYNKMAAFLPEVMNYAGNNSANRFDAIIPVGLSIQNARTTYLSLLKYNSDADELTLETDPQKGLQRDGGHLSYNIGRYIAALTFAETIIPDELRAEGYVLPDIRITESVGKLPKEYSIIAQKSVHAAVESWRNGSLAVTNIEGYTEDPAITAAKTIDSKVPPAVRRNFFI